MKFAGIALLMAACMLSAQAPISAPGKLAEGACRLTFKGRLERSAALIQPGAPPLVTQVTEEFDITVPGRIEKWEPNPGAIEFRFNPDADFSKASGNFKTNQTLTRPMLQTSLSLEGNVVSGMGTWYLHTVNVGGQIIPQNIDVPMRGKVTASTDPNMKVGRENVPVSVLTAPLIVAKEKHTAMPPLKFTGVSLWALQKNKTPFTAQAELNFNHRGERDSVRGTVHVTFEIDPTR